MKDDNDPSKVAQGILMNSDEIKIITRMKEETKRDISNRTTRKDFKGFISWLKDLMIILDKKFRDLQFENQNLEKEMSKISGTYEKLIKDRISESKNVNKITEKFKQMVKASNKGIFRSLDAKSWRILFGYIGLLN